MKTEELIDILTQDNKKISPLKSPGHRFLVWTLISLLSMFVILFFSIIIRGQYHIPQVWESNLALIAVFLSCGIVLFKRNIPGQQSRYDYLIHNIILVIWFCFLVFSVSTTDRGLFSSLSEELKNHGLTCVELILLITMIPLVLLNFYLKNGFVEPSVLYQLSVYVLPFAFAQIGISFLCPNETSTHILAWHNLALIPFYSLISFLGFKLIQIKD
ncbi:NrsF family protein [Leptospira sp. 2 VSF19]|uniref:NrsF family protein n=1 Tax=Leptospira soteropolitanensis TaxID=2950025 RepID=A0AAW5VK13_9LEPT|nr:NrsF family protein [Leptospira soteropolitanensis]MCW7491677.1 NrsF family protein [Leptospira soteropolitanensis]MCW7499261.1 NrsF family protein [Leptospira soteropolitanensis]MCW7521147.1 NrsF family protein [Leptospira soteropolitanensis]MCW7525365.1 NrsF family protein [Leptospira soteropolitanensis]MCW7529232.1 NrsF family protein [Leptospira soteropolitanensis]